MILSGHVIRLQRDVHVLEMGSSLLVLASLALDYFSLALHLITSKLVVLVVAWASHPTNFPQAGLAAASRPTSPAKNNNECQCSLSTVSSLKFFFVWNFFFKSKQIFFFSQLDFFFNINFIFFLFIVHFYFYELKKIQFFLHQISSELKSQTERTQVCFGGVFFLLFVCAFFLFVCDFM